MKGLKQIGWVPYCTSKGGRGFWPGWIRTNKRYLKSDLAQKAHGFKFKIVPIYAAKPRKGE